MMWDFWIGYVVGSVVAIIGGAIVSRAREYYDDWKQTPKIYRIEDGPADNRFIAIYPDGMAMLCSSAGSLPVEPKPVTWLEARSLRNSQD